MSVLPLFLAAILAVQESSPEFTKLEIVRERVGHKVIADAVLRNAMRSELADVRITFIYYDQDDEVRRTSPVSIPRILPGASAPFRVEAEQVANFSRYEVYVEFRGTTRLYLGADPTKLPELRRASPPRPAVTSHRASSHPGELRVTLSVVNRGETEADDPTASILLTGKGPPRRVFVRLAAALVPGTEDTFEVTVPVDGPSEAKADIVWLVAEGLTLGDAMPGVNQVQILRCRVDRLSGGVARVAGTAHNGTSAAVGRVQATFRLGGTDVPYALPGILQAGESRPFECYVPDCPPLDGASFNLDFEGAGKGGDEPPPRAVSARRVETKRIEVNQVQLPPVPEKPVEGGPLAAPQMKVELRGLMIAEGGFLKNGKYSGDILFLRVAFLDEKGNPAQPNGTLSGTLFDGRTLLGPFQRNITRDSWKGDASRVNGQTATESTMAFDRKANELWVAIYRAGGTLKEFKGDFFLEVPEKGSWTWKGIGHPWAAAPRTPDVTKK